MTRATLTLTLLSGLVLSACGGDEAQQQQEEAGQPAAEPAQAAADSAQQAAAADSARRAQEMARITETMGERIHFAFDRAVIRAEDRPVLDRKVELLEANPSIRIQIGGYCDARGPAQYNEVLGMQRAQRAKRYLTSAGVAADRIEAVSFGETQPLDQGTTREAYARNRRAEFTITAGGPASGGR
jgi:peptidoglycan-associated lipoprotein